MFRNSLYVEDDIAQLDADIEVMKKKIDDQLAVVRIELVVWLFAGFCALVNLFCLWFFTDKIEGNWTYIVELCHWIIRGRAKVLCVGFL